MAGDRYAILFEVFKELVQQGEVEVIELRERLRRKGLITDSGSVRKFYYYIRRLEEEGFLTSERRGKRKYLKPLLGHHKSSFLEDRWSGFIAFLLLALPGVYRWQFAEQLSKFSQYLLGFDLTKYISMDFYMREMVFLPEKDIFEILGLLIKALRFKWVLTAYAIKDKTLKFIPQHLHFRDGKIYIIGISPKGKEIKLRLDYIKALSPVEVIKQTPVFELSRDRIYEPAEKPFIFGITFHKVYMHEGSKDPLIIFPTQYYSYLNGEYYVYYLVGFTGDRFAKKFLTILYDDILEPNKDMLEKLEISEIKNFLPNPPKTIEENTKRFFLFLETLEKHLDLRNLVIKRKKCCIEKTII